MTLLVRIARHLIFIPFNLLTMCLVLALALVFIPLTYLLSVISIHRECSLSYEPQR